MAAFSISCKSLSLPPNPYPPYQPIKALPNSIFFPRLPPGSLSGELHRRRMRGLSMVTRAGPSTSQFIFAFAFPLTLLAITVVTAWRIGDKLDEKFLEELAMNEALREAEEYNDDDDDDDDKKVGEVGIQRKEEPALPRTRNRPKREV
uniref:Uncharacterized protein n=1 Tax=Opuntia streptacantha TaxID=393608 RepID=A0A7C9DQI3_OPUST